MASYLRQGSKETEQHTNELKATEANKPYETREPSSGPTLMSTNAYGASRTRFLTNHSVLDTLDSVHRSLLFNNLQYEPDEYHKLERQRYFNDIHTSTITTNQASNSEEPLVLAAATDKVLAVVEKLDHRYGKVNIAAASTWSEKESCGDGASGLAVGNKDAAVVKDTLEDWNNNINRECRGSTKVKMMVQQIEKAKEKACNAQSSSQGTLETHEESIVSSEPLHRNASMYDVETSDFESASVTSGSSAAEGGWRSVRTSSAFSEGSRDVVSIERFDLATAEAQEVPSNTGRRQDEQDVHNTMITININYRCDTNPIRTGNKTTESGKGTAEKTVDIVVLAPGPPTDFKQCVGDDRKSSSSNDKFGTADKKQSKDASAQVHAQSVACECMDLEEEDALPFAEGHNDVLHIEQMIENENSTCNVNKADHHAKHRRSSLATNRSCQTPEHEEYHDCDELHDSTLSFYEQATSQPVTPKDSEKKRRSAERNCSGTSSSIDNSGIINYNVEPPMIRIVQELSADHRDVTSTVTLDKAQIQEMQKMNDALGNDDSDLDHYNGELEKNKKSRRSGSINSSKKRHDRSNLHRQQRIIDDNFCNEILDSTIHFDRLYGINREQSAGVDEAAPLSPSPTRARLEECLSDSVLCDIASPGDESFDSAVSVGKLEGKPRYSGKTMGRLMMKRLKKLQQTASKGVVGGLRGEVHKVYTSDTSASSAQVLQTSGPKKPPRTFANSPKRTTAPSCPTRKDLDDSESYDNGVGWTKQAKPAKAHQVGWTSPAVQLAESKQLSIPAQVYSMLHYSEDESHKRLIKTGSSKPEPQQSSATKNFSKKHPYKSILNDNLLGPKIEIDTVDGATTPAPRRHSSSTDFDRFVRESNVKSTPHRRGEEQHHSRPGGMSNTSATSRRVLDQFLCEERQANSAQRKFPSIHAAERRRRTTGGIFERRRQQQENFLDDARRSNCEPRRRKQKADVSSPQYSVIVDKGCPMATGQSASIRRNNNINNNEQCSGDAGGKVAKRRTFRKVAILKRTRTLFEASKKKIWSIKKFETPKKINTVSSATTLSRAHGHDPNINRNSSTKKKQNLHHKHLGFTPDHKRCESCQSRRFHRAVEEHTETDDEAEEKTEEDVIVPLTNHASQYSMPQRASYPAEENKENNIGRGQKVGTNRKSARSLNFAMAPPPQCSTLECSKEDAPTSPRKSGMQLLNETKFLKTLLNFKISPKRMFRFASQSSTSGTEHCTMAERESHGQGEFHSFDDLNLDNVAQMGDLLNNIRLVMDGCDSERIRNTGQAWQDNSFRQVEVYGNQERDLEESKEADPIYQEISPKCNKTVLNEFISTETNKRYLMVNNNPNILYATVSKARSASVRPGLLGRARSLTNVAVAGAADPIVTSTPVSKQLNNISKSQRKPSNRRAAIFIAHDDDTDGSGDQRNDTGNVQIDSSLYSTAVAETGCHYPARNFLARVGGIVKDRKVSPFDNDVNAGSSFRRSLFSEGSSHLSPREVTNLSRMSTDESDISVLQDEEKVKNVARGGAPSTDGKPIFLAEPPIVRERVEDRFVAALTVRREHERLQQKPAPAGEKDGVGRGKEYLNQTNHCKILPRVDFDEFSFEKDIIVEERKKSERNDNKYSGATAGREDLGCSERPNLFGSKKNNIVGAAPLGYFDTDSEIESLRRYEDKEIEDLIVSLHDTATLSDMASLETDTTASSVPHGIDSIGYDTVDLAPRVARVSRCALEKYDHRNLTVDTVDVSELISHPGEGDTFATSNVSPITGSPSSEGKFMSSPGGGNTVMRNLKDKLRSSFRKSKTFIKSERQRLANFLIEERRDSKRSTATPSSSCSSSTSSTPRKRPGKKQDKNAAINVNDQDTDEVHVSVAVASSTIPSAASMTELSNQYMSELMLQIKRQADARKQIKQALAICRSTREFECSQELIEAERLLLLATLKETAARNELSHIDYAANGMIVPKRKRVGVIALNHFEFPLKDTAIDDALFNYFYVVVCTYKDQVKATRATEQRSKGQVYFRDCEIRFHDLDANYEIRVEVFVLELQKNSKNLSFESRYHLDKDTQKCTVGCPSPSKKLREAGKILSFRSSSPKSFDFDNEFSRFKSHGFLTLTSFSLLKSNGGEPPEISRTFDATYTTARTDCRSDQATTFLSVDEGGEPSSHSPYYSVSSNFQQLIRRQGNDHVFLVEDFKYLTLDSMAYTSYMTGTIGMSVISEIRFEGSDVCGFLDVGVKGEVGNGISWNRRWCRVNGFVLQFWNYPQECQEKHPIQCIDLVKCVNERIELAERSICSRRRTLKVDIFASKIAASGASCNSSGIGSYKSNAATTSPNLPSDAHCAEFGGDRLRPMSPCGGRGQNNVACFLLAVDTQADLMLWLNELNRVVKFLKEWKI